MTDAVEVYWRINILLLRISSLHRAFRKITSTINQQMENHFNY